MIKRLLSLTLTAVILLPSAAPAAMRETSVPQGGAPAAMTTPTPAVPTLPSTGLSAPQLPLSASIASVAAALESGSPAAMRALAAQTTPAAALAASLAAQPKLLEIAAVRAEAERAFGAPAAARLQDAAAKLAQRAQADPEVAAAAAALASKASTVSPDKASAALTRLIKEFGTMARDAGASPAVAGAESATTSRLAKPARRGLVRSVKAVLVGAVIAVSLLGAPAHAQQAPQNLPAPVGITAPALLPQNPAGLILAQAGVRQGNYVQARDISDAIKQWHPGVRLIVVGDVALDAGTLKAISAALDGKTWTVVIVADGQGHSYTDAEGRSHYDLDAVDFGTGQGIYNKGGFGDAVNAQTGERSGVILTIVMKQHKLYLHGSEAMRAHGLDVSGGRAFQGDLDQWAISNMRNGGDVLGAVRETVTNIDGLLTQSISADAANGQTAVAETKAAVEQLSKLQAEFSSRHAAAAGTLARADLSAMRRSVAEGDRLLSAGKPRQAGQAVSASLSQAKAAVAKIQGFDQAYASSASQLTQAGSEVDALDHAAAAFRAKNPKAAGDLARPQVAAMRERLSAAKASLETDPQAAVSAAAAVTSQARAQTQALAELPAGADQIAAAQKLEQTLSGKERAGDAHDQLVTARQSLRDAAEARQNGSASWSSSIAQAKSSLAAAEQTIAAADAAAHTKAILFWLFNILAGLFTLGGSIFLNRRAARAEAKAETELKKWDDILEKKLDAIIDQLDSRMDVYVGAASGPKSRGWVGQTADLTAQIRRDAGFSKLLLAKARQVHDQSTALVRPKAMSGKWLVNLFWPSNYRAAEALLATTPITFTPADGLDAVFGKAQDWRGDLYGDVKDYEAFSKNFTELMAEFNGRSKTAVESLDKLEYAVTKAGDIFTAVEASASAAAKTQPTLANTDGLFAAAAAYAAAIPAALAITAAAREAAKTDPIKGIYGGAAEAKRVVDETTALVNQIASAREGNLKNTDAASAALTKLSVGTSWISAEKNRLSAEADGIAAAAAQTSVAERIAKLSQSLGALDHKTADAVKGAEALAEARKNIATATSAVEAGRAQLAKALDLPASSLMTEPDANPSEFLAAATAAADKAQALLSAGKLDEAKASYDELQKNLGRANAITSASLDSLKTHSAVEQTRAAETERLNALVPERQKVLDSIAKEFAASVMALTSGDASHPNANGTVADNIDEAGVAITAAADKREKALKAFRDGAVLKAADLLSQSLAHHQIAQARLDEITEKRSRLDQSVAANAATRQTLEARVKEYETKVVDDRRTMKNSLDAFATSKKQLASAITQVEAAKPDPFIAGASLAAVTAALEHVWVSARNDFDAFAEVERSLKAARAQLDEAGRQAQRARGDGVADSPAITRAYSDLNNLESAYAAATTASQRPHGDWPSLDHESDRVTNEAAHVAATLKDELAAAARATDAISSAGSKVREATNWTGSYGVYIPGSPGSGELESARAALNRGDYANAISYAESARRSAAAAISTAEAEVMRKRREEEERRRQEEEERRRRQQAEDDARRRSNESSSGSSGSSGSSWGGSSSGNSSSGW
jgi:hypothetical protein